MGKTRSKLHAFLWLFFRNPSEWLYQRSRRYRLFVWRVVGNRRITCFRRALWWLGRGFIGDARAQIGRVER